MSPKVNGNKNSIRSLCLYFLVAVFVFSYGLLRAEASQVYEYIPSNESTASGGNSLTSGGYLTNSIRFPTALLTGVTDFHTIKVHANGLNDGGGNAGTVKIKICQSNAGIGDCIGASYGGETNISAYSADETILGTAQTVEFTIPSSWHYNASYSYVYIQFASVTGTGGLSFKGASSPSTSYPNTYAGPNVNTYLALAEGGFSPTISAVRVATPTPIDYTQNPITFSGTYDNIDTFNQIQISLSNTTLNLQLNPYIVEIPPVNIANGSWSRTISLPFQGEYDGLARLWDSANATSTAWVSFSFGLGATTTTSTSTQANIPGSPTPIDCGTFDIGCYIKNAVVWLFYPSEDSTSQFSNLTLENRFPFSYAYQVKEMRDELFGASQTATTTIGVNVPGFGQITFLSAALLSSVPYASTIRTILGWVLWLMMIEYLYLRILKAHDTQTPG